MKKAVLFGCVAFIATCPKAFLGILGLVLVVVVATIYN